MNSSLAVLPGVTDCKQLFVCWITFKNSSISFFDDPETENFFDLLNGDSEYSQRNVFADQVSCHFEAMQQNFKEILQSIYSKLAFTVDAWWALTKNSYHAIAVH